MLVSGCATTPPTKPVKELTAEEKALRDSVVGEYEAKGIGFHIKHVFLKNGIHEIYSGHVEYNAESKAVEIAQLTTVTKEINKMESVAAQIAKASENWEAVQASSKQTAMLAEEIAAGIAETVKTHDEFMATAHNKEFNTLKLEVEKLRRSETDWANTLVGLLDLVYRLERSAVASGKDPFIQTMGQFQGQCRKVARRVGLVAFEAELGTAFNPEEHALSDEESAAADAAVSETRLPGFRLQGKLVRKPLVVVN